MKRRIIIVSFACVFLGVIAWYILRPAPREPVYAGKTLNQWLEVYDSGHAILLGKEWEETDAAIRNMDTNAIPFLLQMLQAHDSEFKLWFVNLAQRQHLIRVPFTPAENRRRRGEIGLTQLASRAEPAVPALIEIVDRNPSEATQEAAVRVLMQLGPPGKNAIPAVLRLTTCTNYSIRRYAVFALGRIPADADRAVPALVKALEDPDPQVCYAAATTLGQFGPAAKSAVPALLKFIELNRPVPERITSTGGVAFMSLQQIDRDAAAKVKKPTVPR